MPQGADMYSRIFIYDKGSVVSAVVTHARRRAGFRRAVRDAGFHAGKRTIHFVILDVDNSKKASGVHVYD